MCTLIHISGGMDSVYTAYKHLVTEPRNKLFLHHIKLRHRAENRLEQEQQAVNNVLAWFNLQGLRNYEYFESVFDYGNLPRIAIKDIQVVSVFSAIMLKTPFFGNISKIKVPWHKGEVHLEEKKRGHRIRKILQALEAREVELEFPIAHMSRQEMAADMPKELLDMCHCCRKPVGNEACGKCATCKELADAGINIEKNQFQLNQ